jgi:hypothetical protein
MRNGEGSARCASELRRYSGGIRSRETCLCQLGHRLGLPDSSIFVAGVGPFFFTGL